MGRDFFQILPSELTTDILSRLPLRSVAISKCVCKSWLDLLDSGDFKLKVKPPPVLVCMKTVKANPTRCTIFELGDKDEADLESHDLHYVPLTNFDTPHRSRPIGCTAANGLLLLYPSPSDYKARVYICNPLTRKYIVLPRPYGDTILKYWFSFDFCVSKISGQYKVVCIGRTCTVQSFQVYTLGTGIWRHVETGAASSFRYSSNLQVECNNNLHWTTLYGSGKHYFQICGFDIDTECFSIFSPPPNLCIDEVVKFNVFKGCLCFCYIRGYEIVMWLMKEYQVEESWTIEYKLSTTINFGRDRAWVYPIKVFKDGDILMLMKSWQHRWLFYYSNKTKITRQVGMFNDADVWYYLIFAMIFTPSLLSLKSFGFENVFSF